MPGYPCLRRARRGRKRPTGRCARLGRRRRCSGRWLPQRDPATRAVDSGAGAETTSRRAGTSRVAIPHVQPSLKNQLGGGGVHPFALFPLTLPEPERPHSGFRPDRGQALVHERQLCVDSTGHGAGHSPNLCTPIVLPASRRQWQPRDHMAHAVFSPYARQRGNGRPLTGSAADGWQRCRDRSGWIR